MKKKFIHRKEAYFPFSALSLFCKNWFLSFLAFIFLLIEYFGILPKSAFSDELTPTPTWSQEEYFKKAVPGGRHIELDEAIESTPSVHGVAKPHNREKKPIPPTHFNIEAENGSANLTWDSMPNAIGYVLYFSTNGINFTRRIRKPFKKSKITIGVLQNGKKYYFGVVSVGASGDESQKSIGSVIPHKKTMKDKPVQFISTPGNNIYLTPGHKIEPSKKVPGHHYPLCEAVDL